MLNKNPKRLLNNLIEMRQELKTHIESTNLKMSQIDKRITEVLQFMITTTTSNTNVNSNDSGSNKNQYYLGSHENPRQPPKNLTFIDSSTSFGLNSNLHLSQITSGLGGAVIAPVVGDPGAQRSDRFVRTVSGGLKQPTTVYIKTKPSR